MLNSNFVKWGAWAILGAIVFATVSPIEFRPNDVLSVDTDRALGYALVGFAFALAYPRHWKLIAVLLPLGAFGIEALQFLSATRHPRLEDGLVKAFGALCGVGLALSYFQVGRRLGLIKAT